MDIPKDFLNKEFLRQFKTEEDFLLITTITEISTVDPGGGMFFITQMGVHFAL